MKLFAIILIPVFCLLNSARTWAADFDGSKPFICSVVQVIVCPRNGQVEKGTAESIDLPQFFFIDAQKKVVRGRGPDGDERQTVIESVRHENGTLILQGVQLGKAWNAVINEETGKTTLTGATDDTAFIVFAASTMGDKP